MLLLAENAGVSTGAVEEVATKGYATFIGIVNVILPIVIGVILVLGLFYGISLAIKYAKAEEDEDKKKAKSSLINVVVGCLIAIVFVAVVEIVLNGNYIRSLFTKNGVSTTV